MSIDRQGSYIDSLLPPSWGFPPVRWSYPSQQPTMFEEIKMSSIHQRCTGTLYCSQPPRTTRTIHSFMPVFSASITPISFTLVKIQRTMKLGSLNFYGLDGTSIKAQMCDGAIQNWTWFPFLPSPPKVHLDCWPWQCAVCMSYDTCFFWWQEAPGRNWSLSLCVWWTWLVSVLCESVGERKFELLSCPTNALTQTDLLTEIW